MQLCNYFGKLSPFILEGFRFCHVLAVLCLIYITAVLMKWWIKRKHSLSALDQFPGPPGHWLLGHITQFKEDGTDLDMIPKWGEQYPFAFPLQFGPDIKYLYVHHPDYAKPIMATSGPKEDFAYAFLIPWIGEGLLVSSGQNWFRHRRLLTPGFHYDILKSYVNLMADSAKVMLEKWEVYARTGQTFELFQHVSLMTLDSIMKCAFSCQSNCQTESSSNPYIKAVYELSILVNLRFYIIPYHNDIIFYMSPHGYRYRKACKIAHAHTEEVIRQRRDILNKKENQNDAWEKRYLDFLDILLCARDEEQKGLSDEAIRAEVDTFMFEGHDTTASGISWIFYSMACNPEHQQKCREEIQQVLQGKDTMEWEDLNKIPYTTMCIKESLRMYPPVPGIARRLSQPITFFDGRNALAGQRISINIYGIHHNPTVWKNPKVFDPLRFLPENAAKRSPYAFLPFSAGPRNCIGQNFALNEMKVAVALTLKKYVLIKDPDHTPKMISRLVLRSLNGIHLKIKLVEN